MSVAVRDYDAELLLHPGESGANTSLDCCIIILCLVFIDIIGCKRLSGELILAIRVAVCFILCRFLVGRRCASVARSGSASLRVRT
jgi:hypothetical protein